jgi:DNA polymerase-3 subunit gamma/tau
MPFVLVTPSTENGAVVQEVAGVALALYRKYRPRTFAEVIGQEHVTEPLSQALRSGRLHHAYLFSGPRGCGKTSSARILARSLNCEQGPTPEPCGVCASCKSLANDGAGSIDVIEIDAASHGGVDDARELREKAFFAPANSRYKIYVIDEAHMVSSAGFNALLKLVEEPPEYVKFIFATTEPEKVLGTIRSRTHHYPFRLIPPAVLRPYLQQLTEAEGVHVEPTVFPLVVRAGGGSARDTLSVLDQLIAGAGPEGVSYARAVTLLGVTDGALIDEMCDAVAASDGAAAYQTIDRVAEAGHDPRRFASDLLERFRDLIVLQQVPDAVAKGLIDGPADQLEQMGAQATRLGPATLSRCADIVHNGLVEMRGTTAPRLLLELITARMLLPGADDSSGALLQRLERMERRLTLGADEVRPQPDAVAAAEPAPGAGGGGGGISAARAEAAAAGRRAPAPAPAASTPASPPAGSTSASGPDGSPSAPAPAGSASAPGPAGAATAPGPADSVPAHGPADSAPSSASAYPAPGSVPANSAPAEPMAAPHDGAAAPGAAAPPRPEPAGIMPDAPEEPGAAPAAGAAGQLSAAAIREIWPEIMVAVGRKSKKIAALAQGATVRDLEGQTVVLTFRFPAHAKMVAAEPALLSDALYEALGGRWQIRCDVAGPGGSGPVAQGQSGARQRSAPQRSAGDAAPGQAGGGATRQREAAPRPSAAGSSDDDGDGWPEPARPGGLGPAAGGGAGAAATTGTPGSDGDDWPEPVRPGSMPPNDADGISGSAPLNGAGTGPGSAPANGAGTGPGGAQPNGAVSGNVPSNRAGGVPGQQVAAGQAGFDAGTGEQAGQPGGRSSGTSTADGMGNDPGLGTSPAADDRRRGDLNGSGEERRPPHADSRGGPASGEQPAGGVRPRTPNDGPASPSRPASAGLAAARAAAAGAGRGGAAAPGASRGGGAAAPGTGRGGGGAAAPGTPGRSNGFAPNGTSAWSDGSPTEEAPYDPEYDGPISSGAAAQSPAYEGFDPGDEPLDDVIDEKTARQSSEQQAVQLLRDALGAEKISES